MPEHSLIGLVMATHLEAKPFIEQLGCQQAGRAPFPVYRGTDLALIISGMGKSNAAMASAYLCTTLAPSCICNVGAAGATRQGYALGSIYQIKEAIEYDRLHFRTGLPFRHRPDLLDGFGKASVATQDQAILDPEKRLEISSAAELVDMEGAAVIHAARKFNTPCFLFKFVSDTPEHTTDREIPIHIRQYRNGVFEFFRCAVLPALRRL